MKLKFLTLIITAVIILTGCLTAQVSNNKHEESNTMKVHYIDVGQGDCILVQVNGKNLLIDAGPGTNTEKLLSYLKRQRIDKLDYVVATHPHEDHIGAMAEVIKHYSIGEFYAPKVTTDTRTFQDMISALKGKGLKITTAKEGVALDLGSNTECIMLAPNSSSYESLNNYSAVIKITYGSTKFLFTGDAEKLSEKEILDKNLDLESDVLKVGHHGSTSSSSAAFLNKVAPKAAVISCGRTNDYGHPHKPTLTALNKRNIKIYRTDIDGTILIESDGTNITRK